MHLVFWSVVAVDAILLVAVLASTLGQRVSDSGGREMGVFFFGIVPGIVLGLMVLLYVFGNAAPWRWIALCVVAGPGLFIASAQVRNAWIDYQVNQDRLGRGYFSGGALKAMGAAVVQGDLAALRKLAPGIDVNSAGEGGMTLLQLAVDRAGENQSGMPAQSQADVVQTLLQLGAKPDAGMDGASKLKDPAILQALLAAGGNPNLQSSGQPLVFNWLAVLPLENLRLLAAHGLDLNATSYDTPLAVECAQQRRWDLLAFLIERGADVRKPRGDGRTVAQVLADRIDDAGREGHAPEPELLQVQARLNQVPADQAGQKRAP